MIKTFFLLQLIDDETITHSELIIEQANPVFLRLLWQSRLLRVHLPSAVEVMTPSQIW